MNVIKTLLFIVGLLCSTLVSYGQTVTLETDSGATAETICRGTEIQLNLTIDPPRPSGGTSTYNVQWERSINPTFIKNCNFPDATGDCSFVRDTPQATTTYTVIVNGAPTGAVTRSVTITVEQVPNAGLDTEIYLCGKTGTINLFDELDGGPDTGGTWSNGTGTYDTSDPNGGVFTYTVAGGGACPPASASITVRPCGVNDTDGDGVTNDNDQDKDNDGILNTVEDGFCTSTGSTTPIFILEEDFGFGGPTRSRYAEGLGLTYNPGLPQDTNNDGEYNVATSTYFRTAAGNPETFLSTDLIGDVDANGDTDGRYLAINMKSSVFADDPVFVVEDLPVTPGVSYDFSMSIASLNNNAGELPANLTIEVVDQASNVAIFSEDSGPIANGTDRWNQVTDNFVAPAGVNVVTIRVINRQGTDGNGNDIGIDNIFLSYNACDFDRDGIPNSEDLDSDNDGIYDIVESGNAAEDADGDGRFDRNTNGNGISPQVIYTAIDTDADGTNVNFLDIDSDNDGIVDNVEGQSTAGFVAASGVDSDFNGVDDAYDTNGTPIVPVNSNTSPDPDYIDSNSDPDTGDCLTDFIEAYDLDQDGIADTLPLNSDADGDGLDDAFDTVQLDRLTGNTNASNGGTTPQDFPNNHLPATAERDWREEFVEIDEQETVDGCSASTTAFDLFDELTDAAIPGGTWTGPAGSPALTNGERGTYTPGTNDPGVYVYQLPTIGTCPSRSGTVTVNVGTLPDAGTDGTLSVCDNDTNSYNLIQRLGTPDSGGAWTDPDGDPFGADDRGVFDPQSDSAGTYTYTVGTTGCQDTAIVEVTINEGADPGQDDAITLCSSDAPVNLFDSLGGMPDTGGSWEDPNGLAFGTNDQGTLDPSTAISGDYTYTVNTATCTIPATAVVAVTITAAPEAGTDGTITFCPSDASADLFDSLGGTPDTGGSWTDPNGNPFGSSDSGTFDPTVDADGIYTYTVGTIACQDTATVAVTFGTAADAGTDGSLTRCTSDTPVDLFDQLGGMPDAGGSWEDPNGIAFGTNDRGTLDPSVAISGTYIYAVNTATCTTLVTAAVNVTITQQPNAGTDGTLSVCSNDMNSYNLIQSLGTPDSGGTWTDPNGNPFGTDDRGVFIPQNDIAGVYTYTVGAAGCQDTATVTVTINAGADPGEDGAIELCTSDASINLFDSLNGTPDAGGTWSGPGATANGDQGTIDPSTAIAGDYTYTVSTASCPDPATAIVTVSIETTPILTLDDTVCASDRMSYDLIYTSNGNWTITVTPNVGVVDAANNRITGIPADTNVIINASNPSNNRCEETLPVTAPNCNCPTDIPEPVNSTVSNNDNVCFGEANQELMVTVSAGLTANWYDEEGNLVAPEVLTYTPQVTEVGTYSFFIEAYDASEDCSSGQIEILYSISERPFIELFVEGAICVDESGTPIPGTPLPFIDTGLSSAAYTFQWSFEGTLLPDTDSNITATQAGNYSVIVTDIASGCSDSADTSVDSVRAIAPGDLTLTLSNGQFANTNSIIANVPADGVYEYSLDNGPFQTSNVFRNVPLGLRTVTVVDINGCGSDTATIKVFGFPTFFTPNGDGRNDTWNVEVKGDEELPPMDINIFDRYGKLMKKQKPTDLGWDGTYNGEPMPSTDYWYSVQLLDGTGQELRGHFNLRR